MDIPSFLVLSAIYLYLVGLLISLLPVSECSQCVHCRKARLERKEKEAKERKDHSFFSLPECDCEKCKDRRDNIRKG